MRPEATAFLDKARECLAKADGMPGQWPDEAGREAYLAGLYQPAESLTRGWFAPTAPTVMAGLDPAIYTGTLPRIVARRRAAIDGRVQARP